MAKSRKTKPKAASVVPTTKAPEVEALAADLIERHHHGLKSAVVKYGFTAKKGKRFGRVMLVREEQQTLLERKVGFLVIVSKLYWDAYEKAPVRREAALDELLCSMSYDGMTPRIEKPDFKGYRANILRYGAQTDELAEAFKGCQLTLPNVDEIERELAPPPRCNDCGDLAHGRQGEGGVPLCEACWRFRKDCADETSSNADDLGAHCEGCAKFLRAETLVAVGDHLLCWACAAEDAADEAAAARGDESPMAGTTITLESGGRSVTLTGEQFDEATERLTQMAPDELAEFAGVETDGDPALVGVDFTQHAAAGGGE